jgi:pyrophosphate--fructose-6-phosphate 1-phosphotransferase
VETSFGFDTAVRVYSDLIANIARDTLSAKKYYHFVRLMGRCASHITLEAALQTQPNIVLIAEEIAASASTLRDIVENLAQIIKDRALAGKNFGMVLVPEGIIEFIPEMKRLISELNDILASHQAYIETLHGFTAQSEYINSKLGRDASYTFSSLPIDIQRQLLMDRDPHGNVIVSGIETEKLLIDMLKLHLGEEKVEGRFKGTFGSQRHFLGYEGRCAAPTNFDADYAYSLGRTVVAMVYAEVTGFMSVVRNLTKPHTQWEAMGVPLLSMMGLESRKGCDVPVIRKSLVALDGKSIQYLKKNRPQWAAHEHYRMPGPIQYFGPAGVCDKVPCTLALEAGCAAQISW